MYLLVTSNFTVSFLLCFSISISVFGQKRQGIVVDFYSRKPLNNICVINKNKSIHSFTDDSGKFVLLANPLDTLLFSGVGIQLKMPIHAYFPLNLDSIFLKNNVNKLKEVTVFSNYLKFKNDSIEDYKLYRKPIADALRKSKTIFIPPVFIYSDGGISEIASKIRGQKKRDKKLLSTIRQDHKDNFIALYYNVNIVKELLKITDSQAINFIKLNPMPFDFARSTSMLEKKIWIKEKFEKSTFKL